MSLNYLSVVDGFFPDRPTGSARVAWDVAQMVRDIGHNVTVFCPKQFDAAKDVCEHEGISVVRYVLPKVHALDPLKVAKRRNRVVMAARAAIVHKRWDIVHIHSPLEGSIVYAVLGEGPRYVSTVHSPAVLEQEINWGAQGLQGRIKLLVGKGQLKRIESGVLRKAHAIQALSHFTKSVIDAAYFVGAKVSVIPHWCRTDFRRRLSKTNARREIGWSEDAKIVFTLRRLASRMGLDVAIKAMAPLLLERKELKFIIGGSGELEKSLKALSAFLGVRDRICFLGRLTDEHLKRCYEAADLFLLPTTALECFGLIILEALSFGLPVLATDAGAIPEVMRPVLPDFIVPAGQEGALRERLNCWLNGSLIPPLPETLCEYASKNYSEEAIYPRLKVLLGFGQVP